eukprot:CAMPEP_0203859022 /NCGR_PEP_ID=MMETSP0359-20131031/11597_1 /ASSEMBLY_ACC=CAM_ASM_000338 /TAXON_ID=268821 /ORGANISM="Scrippsiella Hangoei, Strain SHTV-5" /LENGTH=458 /DNA_ID=CAMNT_0050775853 /DNA_START=10 /DNA_END=1386 /DNA_ORIENTATION=-
MTLPIQGHSFLFRLWLSIACTFLVVIVWPDGAFSNVQGLEAWVTLPTAFAAAAAAAAGSTAAAPPAKVPRPTSPDAARSSTRAPAPQPRPTLAPRPAAADAISAAGTPQVARADGRTENWAVEPSHVDAETPNLGRVVNESGAMRAICPSTEEVQCSHADKQQRSIAVVIVGLRERLLFNKTLEHVIRRSVEEGFVVHVYMALVDKGNGAHWRPERKRGIEDPMFSDLSHSAFQQLLSQWVRQAGGCLMCVLNYPGSEPVAPLPTGGDMDGRLTQYLPRSSKIGRNVLRTLGSRETLWNVTLENEKQLGRNYTLAMWTRPDSYWFGNITSPADLLSKNHSSTTVWTQDCKSAAGLNDKSAILGRQAAGIMFKAYSRFYNTKSITRYFRGRMANAERYLLAVAPEGRLQVERLNFWSLPNMDGMLLASGKVCFIVLYWCPASGIKGPNMCPNDSKKKRR